MDSRITDMVQRAIWYCSKANLGYDQYNRWDFPAYGDTEYAGECDCSSLVYHCAVEAGFNLPTSGTRYTGSMKKHFTAAGFEWHDFTNIYDVPIGGILYKDGHTAIWTGSRIAEAYGDENDSWRGGKAGDQANETRLSAPRNGWLGYFSYPDEIEAPEPLVWPQEVDPMGDAVDYIIEEGSNGVAFASEQTAYACTWIKWASGRLEVNISDYFNGGTATKKYKSRYYLEKTLEYTKQDGIPEFTAPPLIFANCHAQTGWVGDLQFFNKAKNKAKFWVYCGEKTFPKFYMDAHLEGFWK